MTKVAYLLGALDRGGTESLMLDTLKEATSIHLPCLLIHRKSGKLLGEFKQTGVPIYQQPIKHSFDAGYLLRLRKLFLQNGVQIVHAHLPLDAFLAYWACLGTGIRLVLSIHGYDIGYSKLATYMLKFILRRADVTLFVSQQVQQHYVATYALWPSEQRRRVVYNGVDFSKFNQPFQHNIRTELGIPQNSLLMGSVGNFVNGRDQLTICRLLGELKKRGVLFQFIFIGARSRNTSALYDACVDFCKDNGLTSQVHFLGSRPDVPAILQQLDAFVYASDHDTFGIAVVEAMAAGIPVFVNDWPVMLEITENGRLASIYKTKDVNDLVEHLLAFCQDNTTFVWEAKQRANYIRIKYSIQNHVERLKNIYESIK